MRPPIFCGCFRVSYNGVRCHEVLKSASLSDNIRQEVAELTAMLKDNLEKVVRHGKRADAIVKNMLQHSREGSGEHHPADINAIVDESLNLAYHGARAEKAGFSIALQRDLDPSVGMADIYPQEITRVLLNLISNGFYASEVRHQVVFSHSLNARGRSIASGETEVVSPAKHKRDNAEAIFS